MTARISNVNYRSFIGDRSATSAVEFAILAPIFILMLFGLIAYGIYFGASNSLQQIAADAARTAIAGLDQSERQSLVKNFLAKNAVEYPFIDPGKLQVEAVDSKTDGGQFIVTLSYDARELPIWNLMNGLPLPGMTIAKQTTIRIGGI